MARAAAPILRGLRADTSTTRRLSDWILTVKRWSSEGQLKTRPHRLRTRACWGKLGQQFGCHSERRLREGHDLGRATTLPSLVSRFSAWGWLFAKSQSQWLSHATRDSSGTTKVVPFPVRVLPCGQNRRLTTAKTAGQFSPPLPANLCGPIRLRESGSAALRQDPSSADRRTRSKAGCKADRSFRKQPVRTGQARRRGWAGKPLPALLRWS